MVVLRNEHTGCPGISQDVRICRGILTGVLVEGLPGFSGTRGDGGRREKDKCCTDSSEIAFLSPLPSEILDGLPGLVPWLCRSLAGDLGKSLRVSDLCHLLCKIEGRLDNSRDHFCPLVVHALCRTDTDGLWS